MINTNICEYFARCGGCDLQNIDYANQLKIKDDLIDKLITKYAIVIKDRRNIIPGSKEPIFYRNSIRFEFCRNTKGELKIARHNPLSSKNPTITDYCLLQSEKSNIFLQSILNIYNKLEYTGEDLWQVKVREGKFTNEFMLEIITINSNLPLKQELISTIKQFPEIKSLYQTIAPDKDVYKIIRKLIYGRPVIFEKIGRFKFQISPESFFQTNSLGIKTLYDTIKQLADIRIGDRVLDLYTGTGSIAIYLSILAKTITGVESVKQAVNDANSNARINSITNCKFVCNEVGEFLKNNTNDFDVIILDPPRAGLQEDIIKLVSKSFFKQLVYISCNPETFFRDIQMFNKHGINLNVLQPIDMFPQTHHIELVGLLRKS